MAEAESPTRDGHDACLQDRALVSVATNTAIAPVLAAPFHRSRRSPDERRERHRPPRVVDRRSSRRDRAAHRRHERLPSLSRSIEQCDPGADPPRGSWRCCARA